jgi:hypothetical protein
MSQHHQRAPLPLEQLEGVPQPVVVLLERLLEKDLAQRFQTPNELLKAMPAITGATDARRGITRQNLQQIPPPTSRVGIRKPPARLGPKKISVSVAIKDPSPKQTEEMNHWLDELKEKIENIRCKLR